MMSRVLHNPLNGRFTTAGLRPPCSYEGAKSQEHSNYWSATENNSSNAWNVNFSNGNVNNNNNKYNAYVVRPVVAFDELYKVFYQSVVEAYHDCLRGKRTSTQALEYMQIASTDLPRLAWELWAGTYRPTTSTCFLVKYPKLREVFAANFRDRIVHHWVCLRLEPLFEERFVSQGDVSFNCRKGFGTQKCVEHCVEGLKKVSDNYHKPAWVFKGDLVGFFMSINKDLLWYLLERFMNRWRKRYEREGWARITPDILDRLKMDSMPEMYWDILLRVTKVIVMHCPEKDCIINSPAGLWAGLAWNKSLFTSLDGEPIGNLTTQLFANFLLSFFDAQVLYIFRRKNHSYERFVDDWDNKCDDLPFLLNAIPKMEAILKKLKLEMHQHKRYLQPASHGLALVGSYIKPGRVYLSNRTLARFEERAHGFCQLMNETQELTVMDCRRIEQVVNSYLGFCKGKETYARRKEILAAMGKKLYKYFTVKGHYQSIHTKERYKEIKLPFAEAA